MRISASRRAEGIRGEPLGGESGPVSISACETSARHVQLADHARRHHPQRGVENVKPHAVQCVPDRYSVNMPCASSADSRASGMPAVTRHAGMARLAGITNGVRLRRLFHGPD